MKTHQLRVQVPADRVLTLKLPDDWPVGDLEVLLVGAARTTEIVESVESAQKVDDGMSRLDRIRAHPWLGKIQINYDPTEPLSEDEWPMDQR